MLSCLGFTNRRRTSNKCVCCGCVWLLVLVIVQQCGGDESEERTLNYTFPDLDLNYNSSTDVNAKAMEQLYYVTNFFIDIIQKDDSFPEGLLEDENGKFTTDKLSSEWSKLAQHYAGVVSVAVIGLVFVVLMPLIALFFCCCRCAGRCGGRAQPFEKRTDPCRRVTLGIILSAVAIIILFGVVCAFVTNEYMEDGIKNLPSKLNVALGDTHMYINNTQKEFSSLLVDNFFQLKNSLESDLSLASMTLVEGFKNGTPLGVLDTLTTLGDGLKTIRGNIDKISSLTADLKTEADDLNANLTKIKNNLTALLKTCEDSPKCKDTLEEVNNVKNSTDVTKLPNISESMKDLKINSIEDNINKGLQEFQKFQQTINDTIQDYSPKVLETLNQTGNEIKKQSKDINNVINDVSSLIDQESQPVVKDLDNYIKEYSQYRYYADMGVSAVMLLILLCMTLGLFYGFCGKRPDSGYDDDCCNRATGASFLMLGVYVMFIFSAVLMIITLAHFLLGVSLEKVVCQTLQQPENNQILSLLEKEKLLSFSYTVNHTSVTLNISSILRSCHANDSIYDVLQVSNAINISDVLEYPQKFGIKEKIEDLQQRINTSISFELLNNDTKKELKDLGKFSLDLQPLYDALSSMENNENSENLMTLANKLDGLPSQVPLNVTHDLKKDSRALREIHDKIIPGMLNKGKELNNTANELNENLKFGYNSLSEAIDETMVQIESAQKFLASDTVPAMSKVVGSFVNNTLGKVNEFLRFVVHGATVEAGACEPLSRVVNASLVATCNDILDPFNGFWASIGWCLVLFIPAIILSVKLASLYRKSESYHAAIPDTEYLYDAYADRDNIPLANGPDKKNHHRRYNETYDNSTGYMGDYSSHMGRGDRERRDRGGGAGYHPEEARFNDMAPKYTPLGHWDYSNGALPRYHSPPLSTEYERPPPYYYPGPGDSGRR